MSLWGREEDPFGVGEVLSDGQPFGGFVFGQVVGEFWAVAISAVESDDGVVMRLCGLDDVRCWEV